MYNNMNISMYHLLCCSSLCWLINRCYTWSRSHFVDSISNGRIQYPTAEFNITTWAAASFWLLKLSLKRFEIYLLFFLSMKEQMIHSLRPVGKCNPACYLPSVIQIPPRDIWMTSVGYQAGLHFPTGRNYYFYMTTDQSIFWLVDSGYDHFLY